MEVHSSNDGTKSAPVIELKPLPDQLRYGFYSPNCLFLVIASAKLDGIQLQELLNILKKHKGCHRLKHCYYKRN